MSVMLFAQLLIIVLGLAVIVCLLMVHQLQEELARLKQTQQESYLIFSFEGPEQLFSIKNVGPTPVSLIVVGDLNLSLLLEYQKVVTLKFEPVPMLSPRETATLKFKIFDGGYPLHADAQHSLLPHLKASSFEARIAYRDWQNVPRQAVIVKDGDRFFAKAV
jgi:hypothetical protein